MPRGELGSQRTGKVRPSASVGRARSVLRRPAATQRTIMSSKLMVALPYVLVAIVLAYVVNHIFY
jgi:hypothetical protein